MRLNSNREQDGEELHLAGSLIVAHPSLLDSHFKRTVVLLTAHSAEEGSLGVVVNRPLFQTLGQYDSELAGSEFSDVPLYEGGPVGADQPLARLLAGYLSEPARAGADRAVLPVDRPERDGGGDRRHAQHGAQRRHGPARGGAVAGPGP